MMRLLNINISVYYEALLESQGLCDEVGKDITIMVDVGYKCHDCPRRVDDDFVEFMGRQTL